MDYGKDAADITKCGLNGFFDPLNFVVDVDTWTTLNREWKHILSEDSCAFSVEQDHLFWRIWHLGKHRLPEAGMFVTKTAKGLFVAIIISCTSPAKLEAIFAELEREARQLPLADGDELRRLDERNERDDRRQIEAGLGIQYDARLLLDEWGEFTSDKRRLRELLVRPPHLLNSAHADIVSIARHRTEKRAALRLLNAKAEGAGGVDWPDDQVVRAVNYLTTSDDDHASIANDRGWSSSDSPAGHWCHKMLQSTEHREVALKAARQIVGRYNRQLSMAGIIGRAV